MDGRRVLGLMRSCHPGPTVAVTAIGAAFAVSTGMATGRLVLVVAAVFAGQLSIGWSNDLIDVRRDRTVGRLDKPLATGELPESWVRRACGTAVVATIVLSLACGPLAGLVHLACVAAGWAYNLRLKATVWSWLPYAVAFGGAPVFVTLAGPGGGPTPLWCLAGTGALLGVGAHLVNVLPDLEADRATGVRGLAHRMGPNVATVAAVTSLLAATALLAVASPRVPGALLVPALVGVVVLAGVAAVGRGRVPFGAAIGIAAIDVLLLVAAT